MKTVTIKVDEKVYLEIKDFYTPFFKKNEGDYIDFFAKVKNVTITGYTSKKKTKSIVFVGLGSIRESTIWKSKCISISVTDSELKDEPEEVKPASKTTKSNNPFIDKVIAVPNKVEKTARKIAETAKKDIKEKVGVIKKPTVDKKPIPKKNNVTTPVIKGGWVDLGNQIGSDEVGTGDFIGPIIVVGCVVKKTDMPLLAKLGVKDSKKLTDEKIKEIAPILASKLEFSKLTLGNIKYNTLISNDENINSLKAKLHNRVLLNLSDRHPEIKNIYIDQFVNEEKYYQYLNDPNERQVKGLVFRTKGESLFPSVAAASVIARFAFLQEIELINQTYHVVVPLGAGAKVNEFAKEFIEKFGILEFNKICKRNFANYKEVISAK